MSAATCVYRCRARGCAKRRGACAPANLLKRLDTRGARGCAPLYPYLCLALLSERDMG